MYILNLFFMSIILLLLLFIIKLLSDLKHINDQTEAKLHADSNFVITSDLEINAYNKLCKHLNVLYERCQQAQHDETKREAELKGMLANIAHDVRTPLTSVQGYLEILQAENGTSENEAYFKIINQRITDIRNLLEQFFIYSKLINKDYKLEECDCNIYDICCESLAGFFQLFNQIAEEPIIHFEQHDFVVRANKDLLRRVFDNLIHNSIIHGDGEIRIIQKDKMLIVSNQLKASADIDSYKLFERFYKADASRSNISSGLGLSIVQEIIHVMGWEITAEIKNNKFYMIITMEAAFPKS